MFNPTWLYTGAVYAGGVFLARRWGIAIPRRVAVFFFALVFVFFFPILTQDAVNTSVDFLGTLPPWEYTVGNEHQAGNRQLNDLALQIVPWAHQVRESWRSLTPPLWNPYSGGGYPLLASAQSSALSPLRILGLPLSLAHALSFEAAMKVLLALTFTFLWCRRRGYSEVASTAGGVAFGFSTFTMVWLHFPLATTACFVPAVFYILDLLAEQVSYGRFVALSVVGATMLFGGHPETVAHTAFLATLYVLWIVLVEKGKARLLLAILGASVVTLLLAAPFLAPFAEAVTKSKRYQEISARIDPSAVPHSDWPSAILLLAPQFHGRMPHEAWGPAHAESISGFAGILGVAAWLAVAVHVVRTRQWRSHEMFFLLAALIALGVILDWPLIGDLFRGVFHLAANARVRLLLVLLQSVLAAATIDLIRRDPRSVQLGILGAGALLLTALLTTDFTSAYRRDTAVLAMLPSVLVLFLAAVATIRRRRAANPADTLSPEHQGARFDTCWEGCIAPLIRLWHLLPPKRPGGEGSRWGSSRREAIPVAQNTQREPSPLRRGEKVPKADEGSPRRQKPQPSLHAEPVSSSQSPRAAQSVALGDEVILPESSTLTLPAPSWPVLLLLTAIVLELWSAGRDWNPVVTSEWMYPKTPMLQALDDLAAEVPKNAPFRIVGNAATFFPNVSAIYGYEDVRAHDPMANGRYIGLLSHVIDYDPTEYFARWPGWEHPLLDYLNARFVLTSAGGELPDWFHLRYDGPDGRIFENTHVLPRFFSPPNVIIVFNDAQYAQRLKELRGWSHTALLDKLEVEAPQMHDDFFLPRPPGSPQATTRIVEASPAGYRIHVRAPRWSLVTSSVPWWPGWKVERNGARVEPIRVNGAFLGFAVPPGELDVRVWYDPWTFRFGSIVAAATVAALIALGLWRRSRVNGNPS